jgi:hypothetical protein
MMPRPLFKKLFFPIVLFAMFSLLLRESLHGTPIARQTNLPSHDLVQLPTDRSIGSTHEYTNFSHSHISNADQANVPAQQSQWKVPNALVLITRCSMLPNGLPISHVALPNRLYNISMSPSTAMFEEKRKFWNPTIVALPRWAANQYALLRGKSFARLKPC